MTRSFALDEQLEAFIDRQVELGNYNDADEVVRAGLRLLELQDRERQLELEEVRNLIAERRKNERTSPAEKVFARLERRIRDRME